MATPVSPLLLWSRPAAVVGGVWAVVIRPAIDALAFWAFPHIGEKVLKLQPAFANRNASTTPFFPARKALVEAASLHHRPRAVGSGSLTCAAAMPMRASDATALLSLFTATGLGVAASEIAGGCQRLATAVALAMPQFLSDAPLFGGRNDDKHAEPFTDHACDFTIISDDGKV